MGKTTRYVKLFEEMTRNGSVSMQEFFLLIKGSHYASVNGKPETEFILINNTELYGPEEDQGFSIVMNISPSDPLEAIQIYPTTEITMVDLDSYNWRLEPTRFIIGPLNANSSEETTTFDIDLAIIDPKDLKDRDFKRLLQNPSVLDYVMRNFRLYAGLEHLSRTSEENMKDIEDFFGDKVYLLPDSELAKITTPKEMRKIKADAFVKRAF